MTARPYVMRALTREIADASSPVRRFLDQRFTIGLGNVQQDFRTSAPALVLPPVPASQANPGTVGGAADWLLRFLVFPHPDVQLAMAGAARHLGPRMMRATADLATLLGAAFRPYRGPVTTPDPADALIDIDDLIAPVGTVSNRTAAFTGPMPGSQLDEELLARGCWALALLTEAFRSLQAATMGPLARFRDAAVTVDDLLALIPPAGLDQLTRFRKVFESGLIPLLASRHGQWTLGPTFTGSILIGGADGDLIAAGLLVELKTTAKLTLSITDTLQMIGYALLDFEDTYELDSVGLFSARYSHLATWGLSDLLSELADHSVDIATARQDFRTLLLSLRLPRN